jgi:hypothetical protein
MRFRAMCRGLAALFLLAGSGRLLWSVVPLADPVLGAAALNCAPSCSVTADPVRMLESDRQRERAWRTPGMDRRLAVHAERLDVRLMVTGAKLTLAIPLFLLLGSLAAALRSLARHGLDAGAVRWLKRAALAAVGWSVAQPIASSLRLTAFSPITDGRRMIVASVNLTDMAGGLIAASAAWITVRLFEEALSQRRELEEIV